MSKPMRRAAAVVATAALAVSLSACTGGRWVQEAPPAAGTQTDAADGAIKLRNFVVVSDKSGEAILVGGITSRDAANEVTAIGVTAIWAWLFPELRHARTFDSKVDEIG